MFLPAAIAKRPEINAAVAEIARELSPAIMHIRYEIDQDWSGEMGSFLSCALVR
jgi:hypothetical protein